MNAEDFFQDFPSKKLSSIYQGKYELRKEKHSELVTIQDTHFKLC